MAQHGHGQLPDDDWERPRGGGGLNRRQAFGMLGIAGAAAASVGTIQLVTDSPDETDAVADNGPAEPTSNKVGLAGGANGFSAPTSDRNAEKVSVATEYKARTGPRASTAPVLRQLPTILSLNQGLHVGRRLSYGLTPSLRGEIARLGAQGWLDQQLGAKRRPEPEIDELLKRYPLLGTTPGTLKANAKAEEKKKDEDKLPYFAAHDQLAEMKIARAVWGTNHVEEMLVEFFADWFNVPIYTDKTRFTAAAFDRDVIRKYVRGRFVDMLWASTTHPGMLDYLDNSESDGRKDDQGGISKINQNLGRELLELHSLGAADPITGKLNYDPRKDIVNAALAISGLSVDKDTMRFQYKAERHYVGPLTVAGWRHPNADRAKGVDVALSLVRHLATRPATARTLAAELVRRFVQDVPPAALVQRLAATYLRNNTAILPVMRELVASREFALSVGAKYRRPLDSVAATMRVLGVKPNPGGEKALDERTGTLEGLRDVRYQLSRMGQVPHGRSSPDGYPEFADAWLSGMGFVGRANINMSFSQGWWKGLKAPELTELYGGKRPRTYGEAVSLLTQRLLFQPVSAAHAAALVEFLGKPAGAAVGDDLTLGGRLSQLVALILDAPYHALR